MRNGLGSMMAGAAVAALLVLPAVAGDNGWVVWPTKSFNANALHVENIIGNVRVNVADGPMKVDVAGSKEMIAGVTVKADGHSVHITGSQYDQVGVWDWQKWFDFSHINDPHNGKLFIKVTVPKGADVNVGDMVGDTTIGDTYGPVRLETVAGNATVGRVATARISMAGSGKTSVGDVAGELRIEIAGSGHITAHNAASVRADIAGSGDAAVGTVGSGINIDIAGAGDFSAVRVNGPVKVDIAGSGTVKIADGYANPLHVDIIGAGDLYFGGMAVDPHISAMGSGDVHLKAYKGKLSNTGMADVHIGDKSVPATNSDDDDSDDDDK